MKRAGDSPLPPPKRVKKRTPLPNDTSRNSVCLVGSDAGVRELAKPYLLATAKVPLDVFSFHWSLGKNRFINRKQVENLCDIFSKQSLDREYDDHHIRGLCSRAEVEQITQYLQRNGDLREPHVWPSFVDWMAVNRTQIELMAGQHRVEALREHVLRSNLSEDQLWWICDLYDKDTLPPEVNIRLRANRADPTLPDSHGQIWNELATLASTDEKIFNGSNAAIEKEMLQRLLLSSGAKFPIRRLVTLWKNIKWKKMITAWCCTPLGQATFNISTWDEMARCRIDDFWFEILRRILKIITGISGDHPMHMSASDWITLTKLSQAGSTYSVDDLFYPPITKRNNSDDQESRDDLDSRDDQDDFPHRLPRATKFLTALTDDEYDHAHQYVLKVERGDLVDIHSLLKAVKREAKVISSVMLHVVWWLNPNPTLPKDRENNKPSFRLGFLPALTTHHKDKDLADEESLKLEREIVLFVRSRYSDLTSYNCQPYLLQYPRADDDSYATRFHYQVWKDLLQLVQAVAGSQLQCPAVTQFHGEDVRNVVSEPLCAMTQAMCSVLPQVAEFSKNPALNNSGAIKALSAEIQPIVAAWAVRQCGLSLQPGSLAETDGWPESSINIVRSEREKFDLLLEGPASPLAPTRRQSTASTSGDAQQTATPTPSPNAIAPYTSVLDSRSVATKCRPDTLPKPAPVSAKNNNKSPAPEPPAGPAPVRKEQIPHLATGNVPVRHPQRTLLNRAKASWRAGHIAKSSAE